MSAVEAGNLIGNGYERLVMNVDVRIPEGRRSNLRSKVVFKVDSPLEGAAILDHGCDWVFLSTDLNFLGSSVSRDNRFAHRVGGVDRTEHERKL